MKAKTKVPQQAEEMPPLIPLPSGVELFAIDANGKRYPVKAYRVERQFTPEEIASGLKKCADCEGEGVVDHECDCDKCTCFEEDCDTCDGTGKVKLDYDDGQICGILAGVCGEIGRDVPILVRWDRFGIGHAELFRDRIKKWGWKNCTIEQKVK